MFRRWLVLWCASVSFSAAAAPLQEVEVLASARDQFPRILQFLAQRRGAEAELLEAQGAFDIVFAADGFARATGFWDGIALKGKASQRLRPLGAEIYAEYKISDGEFPIYEDINFTNNGGAARVGVLFSLLRDRDIDEERFNEIDARLGIREADLELLLARIGVQQQASLAYWRWVVAGRRVDVYRELLTLAADRQEGLEEQVRSGAQARITLVENQQNITRRQSLVAEAEGRLKIAANALSYYLRDESGVPRVPTPDELPGKPTQLSPELLARPTTEASEALTRRPELALLRNAIEREQNKLTLAENDLRPKLDLSMYLQEGVGGVGEGGSSRDSTDTVIGFEFSVPLQRREFIGRVQQSQARLEAQRFEQQLVNDRIDLEVRNILLELTVSQQLIKLADLEVQQSLELQQSEQLRFERGASDFFLVNIRERALANAQVKLLEAELSTRLARANFDAATVNLSALGLSSESAALP